MSGRYEKEMELERKIKNRLKDVPSIIGEYYYSLIGSGKSYETAYKYINYIIAFYNFTFETHPDEQFYLQVL